MKTFDFLSISAPVLTGGSSVLGCREVDSLSTQPRPLPNTSSTPRGISAIGYSEDFKYLAQDASEVLLGWN